MEKWHRPEIKARDLRKSPGLQLNEASSDSETSQSGDAYETSKSVPGSSMQVLRTATPSLAEAPALDPGTAHEYSASKIPAFRNQMTWADFTQFLFLISFSLESFGAELSWLFLAWGYVRSMISLEMKDNIW